MIIRLRALGARALGARALGALALVSSGAASVAGAQTFPTSDATIRRIWHLGMDSSQVYPLAQTLSDSIGPRLTGSPGMRSANDWLVATYAKWGVSARNEAYGTWRGWRRGTTHVDLLAPRVRSLEATMLAWSPASRGPVEGRVILLPDLADSAAYARWMPQVRGAFVLTSFAQPSCRPDSSYRQFATPETWARYVPERQAASDAWDARVRRTGFTARDLPRQLENAGAAGIVTTQWSRGWGVDKIFQARTERVPSLAVMCEDYGLLFRLAERDQGPRIRVDAQSESQPDVPVFNTIAEIRGTEKPDEYVVLSAHLDSWDAASGATDNATGTVTMLEAVRILRQAYPRPRRTILVGHWSGEEQGLNGSRAFAADHPEVVKGMQVLFNQDNGTGRVTTISAQGLVGAGEFLARWLGRVPTEISRHVSLVVPGSPGGGGSDYASFVCYGAPAFGLSSLNWEYGTYTWHTNRDTFDKIVVDEVKNNATLTAMLVYLAAEDPRTVPRDRRVMPRDSAGHPTAWPTCSRPARSSAESTR